MRVAATATDSFDQQEHTEQLELELEQKADMLSTFSERMRIFGYGEKFRLKIISSILVGWNKMLAAQQEGLRPINRPRFWNQGERKDKKC